MNPLFLRHIVFLLVTGLLVSSGNALAAKSNEAEEQLEIPGQEIRREEEVKIPKPAKKVQEVKKGIPEVPQPITREKVGPAEQAQLDALEHQLMNGTITETEYQIKKDALMRQSNIKF